MTMKEPTFTCGLDAALCVLGAKWKPLILYHLAHGTRRYGELRRAVGSVSDKVLIQQLKELQADGIIDRVDYDGKDGPPGHPDLKGFGCNGRLFFWLRSGVVEGRAAHVGFVAGSRTQVGAAYAAAMAPGATDSSCWSTIRSSSPGKPSWARPQLRRPASS